IEYIVSERLFESLSSEEQKLWHSHDYEIQTGLLVAPRVPELVAKPELQNIAKTYVNWQTDRCFFVYNLRKNGDKLPLGAPSLMMSPQDVNMGKIKPGLLKKRDDEYGMSTESLKKSRAGIVGLERKNPMADYWVHHGKGLAVDIRETYMKKCAPFP
ncbi:unnamed protein product, partial [Thlaspi arvense]